MNYDLTTTQWNTSQYINFQREKELNKIGTLRNKHTKEQ